MNKFVYKGVWWLPETPQKRVRGMLIVSNEEVILELTDSLEDKNICEHIQEIISPRLKTLNIILGISVDGKKITLYKCTERLSNANFREELIFPLFHPHLTFIGTHFQKKEDIKFKKLYIHYSYLDKWVNVSGFKIEPDMLKKEIVIKYKHPEPICASIGEDYKISIDFESTAPIIPSSIQKEVNVKQKTYIKIESSTEKSLEEYDNDILLLQYFLSLGVTEPVYPLAIKGLTKASDEGTVEILYNQLQETFKVPEKSFVKMLFTYRDISDQFETLIGNWFKKADTLKPVYDLYFGILYNPWMYLEYQFLGLTQAIEAYHRRVFKGKYLSDEDYVPICQKIIKEFANELCGTNSSFKEAWKSKMKYGNEYSLRKRLKDLFEKHQEIFKPFIENKKLFIGKVVDTRNYLTHYDKSLEKNAAKEKELYNITQKLKIIMQTCLLSELGFDSEKISKFLSNQIYSWLKR